MTELLNRFGIQDRLQFAIAAGVISLMLLTTLGGSGGATPVFFIYRTLLLLITILCIVACRHQQLRIAPALLAAVYVALALMLISMLRARGSHFDGFYLWYKHAFFLAAFLGLAGIAVHNLSLESNATAVVVLNVIHLVPILCDTTSLRVSPQTTNYLARPLMGLAATMSVAVFDSPYQNRSGCYCSLISASPPFAAQRLVAGMMLVTCAVRAGSRIPPGVDCHRCCRIIASCRQPLRCRSSRYGWLIRTTTLAQMCGVGASCHFREPAVGWIRQYANESKRFTFPVNADVVGTTSASANGTFRISTACGGERNSRYPPVVIGAGLSSLPRMAACENGFAGESYFSRGGNTDGNRCRIPCTGG